MNKELAKTGLYILARLPECTAERRRVSTGQRGAYDRRASHMRGLGNGCGAYRGTYGEPVDVIIEVPQPHAYNWLNRRPGEVR